jgi:hypothetical protein
MATKAENLHLDIAHFSAFQKYISTLKDLDQPTILAMLQLGIVEVSTAFEHALADIMGTTVISKDWADLSCGSDAKLTSVRTCSYGTAYSAPVTNIKNKTGDLLVQCYERVQNKFYYFRIPNSAYSHIPPTSNIEIPFELDGTPRRINRCSVNWWKFEMPSFNALCKGA